MQDAVRYAGQGARIVICVDGDQARQAELRALAPTSFVLKATTPEDLTKALRAALG